MWAATLSMLAVHEHSCKKLIRSTTMVKQNLFCDSNAVQSLPWDSIRQHFQRTVSLLTTAPNGAAKQPKFTCIYSKNASVINPASYNF